MSLKEMIPFDATLCNLGEGALWHPLREELFWFDITRKRMFQRALSGETRVIALPEICSAAAWIDAERLLVASQSALNLFDIATARLTPIQPLEADLDHNRCNDGRADPWGGFWIGTMGLNAEAQSGAIYRYYAGELRVIHAPVTIPNAICFAPDRPLGYFADTDRGLLFKIALDESGWPKAAPEVLVDFSDAGLNPDGAVTLANGHLRVALWGEGAVVDVAPDGTLGARVALPAPHTTCPAFGGPDFTTLFCTSATQGLDAAGLAKAPLSGATFALQGAGRGKAEPAFRLDLCGDIA